MPLYNLPLAPTSGRPISHIPVSTRSGKKRKAPSSHGSSDDDDLRERSISPRTTPGLDPAITNPLSLTPDEVAQYRVAGLRLDQQLPSVRNWPHRSLPRKKSNSELPVTEKDTPTNKPHLRVHHLGVLATVLHRSLLQGDIPRASRAWALLLRTQIDGKGVDIRTSGYWGIGAELLIREGEKLDRRRTTRDGYDSSDEESQSEDPSEGQIEIAEESGERRWGTVAGLEQAKDYYERLILQYPYKRQFPNTVMALDFWPAMFSCEIYGVQYTQKEALRALETFDEMSQDEAEHDSVGEILSWEERRTRRKEEINWNRREEVRRNTLKAAELIAARMDEMMSGPPYSDSHVLHRLRGMLALYVGDLSVPALFRDEEDNSYDVRSQQLERKIQRQRGLQIQAEEREKARKAFAKIRKEGGRVEGAFDMGSVELSE